MEKYGVETETDKKDGKVATDEKRCPTCGSLLVTTANVPQCPNCGTRPFEKR